MTQARFAIVVPTFQADGWLDQALNSIFSQAGRHVVRIHLQDGGSTDATLEIADRWRVLTENPASPFSHRLTMTIDSGPDGGLYDAVARGFEALDPEPDELMTWLNADDLLAPGALASVASCLEELPDIALCGGRVSMIDADGRVVRVNAPVALSQKLVAAGCHDGRRMPFVMQEGTFWRQDLWAKVGGLDPSFRLAGDWDLWRRMARHAEFVTLDVLTAFHRRRPGQLSENLDAYYAEVDRRLTGSAREAYDHVYWSYIASGARASGQAFEGFEGPVAQLDRDSLTWSRTHRFGERLPPALLQTEASRTETRRGGVLSGAKGFEGPYPEWDLPGGIRWITERHARLTVPTLGPGQHAVRLTCRPGVADLSVTIRSGDEVVFHAIVDPQTPARDHGLSFDLWTAGGDVLLDLETTTPHGDPENRLLLVDLTATPHGETVCLPSSPDGARILIAADRQPQGLAATLASLAMQEPRPSVRVALSEMDPVTEAVLDSWRPLVDGHEVIDAEAPSVAGREWDLILNAGVRLAPNALVEVRTRRGAAREIDGRAVSWLRPAAALDDGIAVAGEPGQATDKPLLIGAPGDALAPPPRVLRLIAPGAERSDPLGHVLMQMDVQLRVLTLPGEGAETLVAADIKAWRPHLVIGAPAALAHISAGNAPPLVRETGALLDLASRAEARLAYAAHPRSAARAVFGLPMAGRVIAVSPKDTPGAASSDPTATLLVIGDGRLGASPGRSVVRAGSVDDHEILAWAVSAADQVWTNAPPSNDLGVAAWRCGLLGPEPVDPSPLDRFAGAMLAAADAAAVEPLRRGLRFRPVEPSGFRLAPGHGARRVDDGLEIVGDGTLYLMTPAGGPVRLRLDSGDKAALDLDIGMPGGDEALTLETGKGVIVVDAAADRPTPVRLSVREGGRAVRITLADGRSGGLGDTAHAVAWEPLDGFGREEAAAPDLGLHAPFRWIEGRRARLSVANDKAGLKRIVVRLRTLSPDQRVMVRTVGRTVAEARVEGGDLSQAIAVEALVQMPEGWSEIDLRFFSAAVMPDRSLAAVLDGVEISEAPEAEPVAVGWTDIDGFDFEEPPVPQYGLESAFRWRLPGARIAVRGDKPGRHHVVVRYRTALPGQTLSASVDGKAVARNKAETGRLDLDERLAFDVDLTDEPLEIALDADRYMEGDRPLGFIVQSVSVEPTL